MSLLKMKVNPTPLEKPKGFYIQQYDKRISALYDSLRTTSFASERLKDKDFNIEAAKPANGMMVENKNATGDDLGWNYRKPASVSYSL